MITSEMLERNRQANLRFSSLVRQQLQEFFRSLDPSRPYFARDALLQFVPALAQSYAPVGVQMGLEWYEEMADTGFRAAAPPLPDFAEMAAKSVRYAARHLFRGEPEKTLESLDGKMDKFVKEPSRQVVIYNSDREDNAWWARVPTGEGTCSFCLVLASRGAVYHSERSAGSREYGEENTFHGNCDCVATRLGQFDEYPEGYVPDEFYDMYNESASRVGRNDLKKVLYDLRRRFPDTVTDGVYDDNYLSNME